ncbi:MAG TPA: hypothetical protein VLJ39_13425 [Tepidisphaeraceae bacterium]|nr:hypothetical protein [Tepidisphaeraceae bacterium]
MFLNAIASGNAQAARYASIGSEEDKRWIDGRVGLINGLRNYDQALLSRFGQAAVATDLELKQAIQSLAQDPVMKFDGAIVHEGEDTAEIRAALKGVRLASEPPILMRKENGLWKVDLTAMRQDPRHDPALVQQFALAGKALENAAQLIRSGRYRSIQEAQQAIEQQSLPQ